MYSLHLKPYINYTETIHIHSCNDKTCSIIPQSHILLLIYVATMTNQKKIIKISNGNECVGSGLPVGGVAPLRGCLRLQTGRQESTSLYYTYNIKYLYLSGLLPSVSSCVLHTEHTDNRKPDDNTLLAPLLPCFLLASCAANLLSA